MRKGGEHEIFSINIACLWLSVFQTSLRVDKGDK